MNRKIVLRAVLVVFIALLLSVPLGAQQQTEETSFPIDFVGK